MIAKYIKELLVKGLKTGELVVHATETPEGFDAAFIVAAEPEDPVFLVCIQQIEVEDNEKS